jgi:hypothetical protein
MTHRVKTSRIIVKQDQTRIARSKPPSRLSRRYFDLVIVYAPRPPDEKASDPPCPALTLTITRLELLFALKKTLFRV